MDRLICKECKSEHFDGTILASQPVTLINGVLKIDKCNENVLENIYCTECGEVYQISDFNIERIE